MFKTEKYKIRFERLPIDNESSKAGRYHTGCEIYIFYDGTNTHKVPLYMGVAYLHPKDVPDKIIGKKEALKRALNHIAVKQQRTLIWKAFWEWVSSWSLGHEYLYLQRSK